MVSVLIAHARTGTLGLWDSNGPIYSAEGMLLACYAYLETYALLVLIAKVANGQIEMPAEACVLYEPDSLNEYLEPQFRALCSFYRSDLFP